MTKTDCTEIQHSHIWKYTQVSESQNSDMRSPCLWLLALIIKKKIKRFKYGHKCFSCLTISANSTFDFFSLLSSHSVNRERNISSVWVVTRVTKTGNETQKSLYLLLWKIFFLKKQNQQMLKLSGRTSDPSREQEKMFWWRSDNKGQGREETAEKESGFLLCQYKRLQC